MKKRIITVFGATGAQGGGLARAILDDPQQRFALRAVTRNPDSTPAQQLRARGAELVVADIDDASSVTRAMAGSYGAFLVTNFWEHGSADRELTQAHNLAAAAAQADIRHAVWSTLEDTRQFFPADGRIMPVLQGSFNVPHFDSKGAANQLFLRNAVPVTFLYTSCYWENLIYFGLGPQRDRDGMLRMCLPIGDQKIPWIACEDIGRSAFQLFLQGEAVLGASIGVAGEHLSGYELTAALSLALREPVQYDAVSPDEYRRLPFAGADELGNMFQFKRDFNAAFCELRDVKRSRELLPEIMCFEQWLAHNHSRIPLN